jgi:hypothetical protein
MTRLTVSHLSSSLSAATLTIATPSRARDVTPLQKTRRQAPRYDHARHTLGHDELSSLQAELLHVHERAHYHEWLSTDLGIAACILEQLRISRVAFLVRRCLTTGIFPTDGPIGVPLHRFIAQSPQLPLELRSIIGVNELLRAQFIAAQDFLLKRDTTAEAAFPTIQTLYENPMVGPWFVRFDRDTVPPHGLGRGVEFFSEVSAHLASIAALPLLIEGIQSWSEADERCVSLSPSTEVSLAAEQLLKSGVHPAVLRFCLWRGLHGHLLHRPSDDPGQALDIAQNHPSPRSERVWTFLTNSAAGLPRDEAAPGPVGEVDWEDIDIRLSKSCGLETLDRYAAYQSSGSPMGWRGHGFDEDYRVFDHHANFFLSYAQITGPLRYDDMGRLFGLAGYSRTAEGSLIANGGPIAELVGEAVICAGPTEDPQNDSETLQRIVQSLLYLDLDSERPTPLHRWAKARFAGETVTSRFIDPYLEKEYGIREAALAWRR